MLISSSSAARGLAVRNTFFMQDEANQNLPDLKYDYHDALLMGFQIGSRRELILHISLYEIFYKGSPSVDVRFGAITNFESVQSFFERLPKPDELRGCYARIEALRYIKARIQQQASCSSIWSWIGKTRSKSIVAN